VDDGLRAGLLTVSQLKECSLFREQLEIVRERWPDLPERRLIHELVRRMIGELVSDVVDNSRRLIAAASPGDADAVRACREPLIALSEGMAARHLELKRFLNRNLYRHFHVQRMSHKAGRVIRALFELFMDKPRLLPPDVQERIRAGEGEAHKARMIADYIAGMTDRFAIAEYSRVTDPQDTSVP
jgi:dGTPase